MFIIILFYFLNIKKSDEIYIFLLAKVSDEYIV